MSYLMTVPESVSAAAGDLAGIGSSIRDADVVAAVATTEVLPAAADEVSTRIAEIFAGYANRFRAVSAQAAAFHHAFVQAIETSATSYASAEAAVASPLRQLIDSVKSSAGTALAHPAAATSAAESELALIMGGTLNPEPLPSYVTAINNLFIQSNPAYAGFNPFGLYTPEQVAPFYGSFTLNESVFQGEAILNNAILNMPAGSHYLVFGYSQSSCIATLEIRALDTLPPGGRPSPSNLSFMLIGNGDAPNGGIFARVTGRFAPFSISTYGATPADTPYSTTIYSQEYDGLANFPQYPLDVVADLNAIAGAAVVHPTYQYLTAAQLSNAVQLATSPGYYENGGVTDYYMIPNQDLPLLAPVRAIPFVGTPLADLLQPDLRVLVNLGYNSNGYANVTAHAQVWPTSPSHNPLTVYQQLITGAQQGFTDALVDVGVLPESYYATTYPAINDLAQMVKIA
jgi:PE-PPE domain/PE family